jgi:acetyl esterase/lipase
MAELVFIFSSFFFILFLYFRSIFNFGWKLRVLISATNGLIFIVYLIWFLLLEPWYQSSYFNFIGIFILMFLIFPSFDSILCYRHFIKKYKLENINISSEKYKIDVQTHIYSTKHQLSLDIYKPLNNKIRGWIILIHGGSWRSGNNKDFTYFNRKLAEDGIAVAAINYRLSNVATYPAPIEDAEEAYYFLEKYCMQNKLQFRNVFTHGRSAGGQIATLLGQKLGNEKITGIIAMYTPFDIHWGYSYPAHTWVLDTTQVLKEYLGHTLEEDEDRFKDASPVFGVNYNHPPILMLQGMLDELVAPQHNERMIRALIPFDIPYYYLRFTLATHGFDYFRFSLQTQFSIMAVKKFIKKYEI